VLLYQLRLTVTPTHPPPPQQCDGESNCPSGADELGCGNDCIAVNGGFGWQCADGSACIGEERVCDGHKDCVDDSDEQGCAFAGSSPCPTQVFFLMAGRVAVFPPPSAHASI
jgi:hypothetical protein